jgi:hypothetical protein
MSLRFRKSIKLAPGIRLNFSAKGGSITVGPRGASVNFGTRGTHLNAGIPGTGISSRTKIGSYPQSPESRPTRNGLDIRIIVDDEGAVRYEDTFGHHLDDAMVRKVKRQHGAKIRGLIENASADLNAKVQSLGLIHTHTLPPRAKPKYLEPQFDRPKPKAPVMKAVSLLARILRKRKQIEGQNRILQKDFEVAVARWTDERRIFQERQLKKAAEFEKLICDDPAFIAQHLEDQLGQISWPHQTSVTIQVAHNCNSITMDLDLPEIEEFPSRITSVPTRGYTIASRTMKQHDLLDLYSRHVHGIGFRIAGEAFDVSPSVAQVTLSAYTQRIARQTGEIVNTYIYSVRIERREWEQINFGNLDALDVVAAFERFTLRRKISRKGDFEAIAPIESA